MLDSGAAAIRGVLASFGYTYSGTGGWHITAYATPDQRRGFVNICRGVAMLTSYTLDAEMIEALTVPGQGDGPQVSGAGGSMAASAPPGWIQLLVDLRKDVGAVTELGEFVTARIVAWCLDTCYDRYHDPEGARDLAAQAGLIEVTVALDDAARAGRLTAADNVVWPERSRWLANPRTTAEQALWDANPMT